MCESVDAGVDVTEGCEAELGFEAVKLWGLGGVEDATGDDGDVVWEAYVRWRGGGEVVEVQKAAEFFGKGLGAGLAEEIEFSGDEHGTAGELVLKVFGGGAEGFVEGSGDEWWERHCCG